MKNNFKLIYSTFAFVAVAFSSCFKETDKFGWNADAGSVVTQILEANNGSVNVISLNATPSTEAVGMITLSVSAPTATPSSDVTVTVTSTPTLVTNYNTANGTSYTAFPAGSYTPALSSSNTFTVTIPKTSFVGPVATVPLTLTIDKTKLDLSKQYAIGLTVSSVSGGTINPNAASIVVAVLIKNDYDANYSVTGYFFHPSAPRAIGATKAITTLGATRCQAALGDLTGYFIQFDVTGGTTLTNYAPAGNTPSLPSSGFFTADNPAGNSTYTGAPYTKDNYPNTYSSSSKTFLMHYGYGVGSTSQAGWSREIYEKWVRQ